MGLLMFADEVGILVVLKCVWVWFFDQPALVVQCALCHLLGCDSYGLISELLDFGLRKCSCITKQQI